MKHYYEVDGQRRYYIAKRISKKENKENMLKIIAYCSAGWFLFYAGLFLFLHLLDMLDK
jgi:hypothetical protein